MGVYKEGYLLVVDSLFCLFFGGKFSIFAPY